MHIIAIDPGMTTGVASLRINPKTEALSVEGFQSTDVYKVSRWITETRQRYLEVPHFVIEEFTGGGYRTKESNHTLKVIGFFYFNMNPYFTTVMRTNQQRLSGTSEALKYQDTVPGPHGLDALKHAFAYRRSLA